MLLKIIGGCVICLGAWYLGKCHATIYTERIYLIDDYITFAQNLKSAIGYSGMNMYSIFEKNNGIYSQKFSDFLLKKRNDGIDAAKKYNCVNKEEKECVRIITHILNVAEGSSDTEAITNILDEGISQLTIYKKQIREEYCGKIKTSPQIGLIVGLFVAVLIL